MLDSLPDITHIRKGGFFDFRHVDGETWEATREQFRVDPYRPMVLPTWEELKRFGRRADLRLLLDDIQADVFFKNQTHWRWVFKRGFITDLASVPDFFRSFVDNDDIDALLAALTHDRNFSVHKLTFKQTNELFYKMYIYRDGAPGSKDKWVALPVRAKLAWLAVKSVVGRVRWRKLAKRRAAWTLATTEFERVRG